MLITIRFLLGVLVVSLSLAACGPQTARPSGSSVLGLDSFDPDQFNGGDAWEYLVNPTYTRDGEHANEAVASDAADWLHAVDAFAEAREDLDFAKLQEDTPAAAIPTHNIALAALLTRADATMFGYTKDEAKQIYKKLVSQPQVSDHARFDPEFSIGFCFGRAMIVHGFARNAVANDGTGVVSKKNIPVRKIWVTGPMGQWKHHVATMVAAKEAGVGFWVIDNYVGKVMSPADWMTRLKADYPDANVMFNVSRANRFSEANSLRYYQVLLDDPFFNDFFRDFLKTNVPPILAAGGWDLTPTTEAVATGISGAAMFGGSTVVPDNTH